MSESKSLVSIILAGGLGKRMNSNIPKVLHIVKGIPMICHIINRAFDIGSKKILIIVGKYRKIIEERVSEYYHDIYLKEIIYIDQPEPLGTGNAIFHCIDWFKENADFQLSKILILSGDVPLITTETLTEFIGFKPFSNILMTYELDNPKGYGRIILDRDSGYIEKIIEEKDCTEKDRLNKTVNCGIYYLDYATLSGIIPKITNNNNSGEYYLTDMINLSFSNKNETNKNESIKGFTQYILPKEKHMEISNINTREDLEIINL